MKKLILLALFSLNAFAYSDYECSVRQYRVHLSLDGTSTHMWLYEGYHVIGQNYLAHKEVNGDKTTLWFYLSEGPTKLTFKTTDVATPPQNLNGWIESKANGWLIWDKLACKILTN